MKILFLDIDSVLNSHRFLLRKQAEGMSHRNYYDEIDPSCTKVLLEILKEVPDIQIVVSSSWRDNVSFEELRSILEESGLPAKFVIGTTRPNIDKAQAIEEWVSANRDRIESYVILDDEILFDLEHPSRIRFYRVSSAGLRTVDISGILEILRNP